MLSNQTITIVQTSFARVEPVADSLTRAFYKRLFRRKPSLRALFPDTMEGQRGKLMKSLVMLVGGLHSFDRLAPMMTALGRRHVAYGVKNEHYELVGEALLGALGDVLGAEFDESAQCAWRQVYESIATCMKQPELDEPVVVRAAYESPADERLSGTSGPSSGRPGRSGRRGRRGRRSRYPRESTSFKLWLSAAAFGY